MCDVDSDARQVFVTETASLNGSREDPLSRCSARIANGDCGGRFSTQNTSIANGSPRMQSTVNNQHNSLLR